MSARIDPAEPCPFCELLRQGMDHPAAIARLRSGLAILNVDQRYRGRAVLIFDRHEDTIDALTAVEFAAFGEDMRRLSRAVAVVGRAHRMNQALLGNVVGHVHWHIIPRREDDPNWGGPPWPVEASQPLADETAYRTLAEQIAEQIA
ncbi:MAG: HIT family protein [Pseudomonadota bacterium]